MVRLSCCVVTNSSLTEVAGEEEAEQKATYRPMRIWYADPRNGLPSEHGAFPAFWQDLKTWPSYRQVRKHFIAFQDTGALMLCLYL